MEKAFKFLPLAFFSLFSGKLLISGSKPTDVAVLAIVSFVFLFLKHETNEELSALEHRIKELEAQAEALKKSHSSVQSEIEQTKSLVGGLKLGQQLKPQMNKI